MKKIVIILLIFNLFIYNVYASEDRVEVTYSACVDGDTIKVNIDGVKTTVRFLAVDTPETVHPTKGVEPYGKEASEYTCDKIKNAKKIELEYDPNSDKTDKYQRALAWVYVDDSLLQNELVSLGYAKVAYLYGDYLYTDMLEDTEKEAADNKLGIWSSEEYISSTTEESNNKTDTTTKTDDDEKNFLEQIVDKLTTYIEKGLEKITNKFKNYLKNQIDKIFD